MKIAYKNYFKHDLKQLGEAYSLLAMNENEQALHQQELET